MGGQADFWPIFCRFMILATRNNHALPWRKRTIGFLLYDLRASGVVRNAFRIAAAAREMGLDVRIWPVRAQGDLLAQAPAGVPIEPILDSISRRQRDFDSLRAVPAIARAIRDRQPAVLFSCGNQMHIHAAWALRRSGIGGQVRFVGRASNALISAGRSFWRHLLRPFERFQFASMDRIVAVSDELGSDLVGTFHFPLDKIRAIPNGVDVGAIMEMAKAPPHHRFFRRAGPPIVLAAGRYSRQKNFEGLIRAFALTQESVPLRLLIVGPGDERERDKLRQLAASLGVGQQVAVEGFVANPFAYMRHADLFVLSSLWEGASNVLLEAFACGCPVVATRIPAGIMEMMEYGALGPLVPPNDTKALAAAMLGRLAEPRNSSALVQRAANYDLGRTLSSYVDFLSAELELSQVPARAG